MRAGLLVLAFAAGAALSVSATTYHLEPDGSGDFATIAQAVGACTGGETIELADGRYTGLGNTNVVIQGLSITIRSASGNPSACRIDCEGTTGATTRAFFLHSSLDETVTLENIAIEEGYADGEEGGAILMNPRIRLELHNVRIRGCHADLFGGAIAEIGGLCELYAYDSHFRENTSGTGAGALGLSACIAELHRCWFIDNSTAGAGGACLLSDYCQMDMFDCLYSRNLAGTSGGALEDQSSGTTQIRGCTFSENAAPNAGALNLQTSVVSVGNSLVVYSTLGEGILWGPATVDMFNCDIFGNAGGDFTGNITWELGTNDNISADPQFCSETPHEHENWTLQEDSPCTALNSTAGIQVGAYGRACGLVEELHGDWGSIKRAFR